MGENEGPLLSEELYVDDSGKQRNAEGAGESIALHAAEKSERY